MHARSSRGPWRGLFQRRWQKTLCRSILLHVQRGCAVSLPLLVVGKRRIMSRVTLRFAGLIVRDCCNVCLKFVWLLKRRLYCRTRTTQLDESVFFCSHTYPHKLFACNGIYLSPGCIYLSVEEQMWYKSEINSTTFECRCFFVFCFISNFHVSKRKKENERIKKLWKQVYWKQNFS